MNTASSTKVQHFYDRLFSRELFVTEQAEPYFQERLLQIIWNEQLFRLPLHTACGEHIEVIQKGIWNVESGPDFHDAVIAFDGKIRRGAVEIHFRPGDWLHHQHHTNSAYDAVVLHAIWSNPNSDREFPSGVPLFDIAGHLSCSIKDVIEQYDATAYPYAQQVQPEQHAQWIAGVPDAELSALLQSYGISRTLKKAERIAESIERHGLEEACYRAFLDAMGYKKNREPFAELAEQLPISELAACERSVALSVMLGAAGLLPDPSKDSILEEYKPWLQQMWSEWWPRRKAYRDIRWTRHGLRPLNVPERRILAAHLIFQQHSCELGKSILESIEADDTPRATLRKLSACLTVTADADYRHFLHFGRKLEKPIALIGASRIRDIVVNVAIPLFFAHCFFRNSPERCHKGRELLAAVPKLQENRRFREAEHLLFIPCSRGRDVVPNACAQLGLLELAARLERQNMATGRPPRHPGPRPAAHANVQ